MTDLTRSRVFRDGLEAATNVILCVRDLGGRDRLAVQIELSWQVLLREREWKCKREGKRPAPGIGGVEEKRETD